MFVIPSDERSEESRDQYPGRTSGFLCCHPERSDRAGFPTRWFCGAGGCGVEGSAVAAFSYDIRRVEKQVPRLGPSQRIQPRAGWMRSWAGPRLGWQMWRLGRWWINPAIGVLRLRSPKATSAQDDRECVCEWRFVCGCGIKCHETSPEGAAQSSPARSRRRSAG